MRVYTSMIQSSVSIYGYHNDATILALVSCMKGDESRHMAINLTSVAKTYFEDALFQEESRGVIAKREASIPTFKRIVTQYVDGSIDIKALRDLLEKALRTEDDWGATGTGFLMEINKLAKYPRENSSIVNGGLLLALSGLSASNLGKHIEAFHKTLTEARDQYRDISDQSSKILVAPGNSAFIISLFAFWLDRPGHPTIYYLSLRRGLKMLLDAGLLQKSLGLRIRSDKVEVTTEAELVCLLTAPRHALAATARPIAFPGAVSHLLCGKYPPSDSFATTV